MEKFDWGEDIKVSLSKSTNSLDFQLHFVGTGITFCQGLENDWIPYINEIKRRNIQKIINEHRIILE